VIFGSEAKGTSRTVPAAWSALDEGFATAFRSNPAAVAISRLADGRLIEVNEAFLRDTGYRRTEVIGKSDTEIGLWVDPQLRRLLCEGLRGEGKLRDREVPYRTKSGEARTALLSAESIRLRGESCVLTLAVDITERKRAEAALVRSEERYALAARGANDGLWDWDLVSQEVYFSPRWKEMLGLSDREVGNAAGEWFSRTHAEDRDRLGMAIVSHLEGLTDRLESEYRMRHRDGRYRWMSCRGLAVRDEEGRATRFVGSQTDITDRKALEAQVLHDALHDPLTGLANRALFLDRLGRSVERGKRHTGHAFAALVIDLDRFKLVNEGLGRAGGDRLLRHVAERISACVRPEDTVARLGDDEFAVLLEEVADASDATRVASRIQEEVRRPLDLAGQELFTSASIGIAMSLTGYPGSEEVLRDAATAMSRAKAQGPARTEVFDPRMQARAASRLRLETDLRHALERGELAVSYQQIVDLGSGRLAGFEALVRWSHPSRGPVAPQEFIALAEDTGLIVPLGGFVLKEACRQLAEWRRRFGAHAVPPVSVNLSARQLSQRDSVRTIREALEEAGVPGRLLHLEVTESALLEDAKAAAKKLIRLKELGIRISLDDFGTGYSSLSLLHSLPVDTLKIDRSFVSELARGAETVRAIVALARSLGMDVVAEGVETDDQRSSLSAMGCRYAQGFLFGPALSAPQAASLIGGGTMGAAAC
jgi:diguanylate cyclase (GGDEF)-like protein/PAS domain S-box-containing protein